uniref:5'-3' exoribonuclease 1 n=1 Tax=Blastobotrys adeninivorans TaxID=409370 RepID=A0A060TFW6_BLAAD
MGIPKFFRYVSERWPLISQLVNESQVPEFDNLYLDMNSILHTCTHKDSDATHFLTEEQMFVNIFNYIEHLFDLIRPKQMFFMAIDGVAPRAKMNQQRARRFRTALDAENARKKAIAEGLTLPTEEPFDSNAITPGTEFMEKLTLQLKYFINRKVSEDSTWQNIEIVLSGHEVPGEGEHKIMEQIRIARSRPDYNSNTRHCLYGLDADLIMLGLLSHDPHFALLREEVTFGRPAKKAKELTEQRFFLLHLSLVREYLELEFDDVKDSTPFTFDFERALDDFILINYFVGNDFLPELPSLLINEGAIPVIIQTYKNALGKMDGYLTEQGHINFERLGVWLDEMTKFELERFEKGAIDAQWMNEDLDSVSLKSLDNPKLTLTPKEKELLRFVKPFILKCYHSDKPVLDENEDPPSIELPQWASDEGLDFLRALGPKTSMLLVPNDESISLVLDVDGIPDNMTEEEEESRLLEVNRVLKRYETAPVVDQDTKESKKEIYSAKFKNWKNKYYKDKFKVTVDDEDAIRDVAENYLEGLQWVLYYYYTGIPSWGWYFRYHYAPCISDMKLGLKKAVKFDLGKPFRPFEQLMGVLPSRSKALVPAVYRPLMYEETSPILDFYPHNFELDMNGKKNDWEAVVKIPFVDENRLLKAMEPKEALLTAGEKKRNSFGNNVQFVFNPQVDTVYPSSLPGVFLDIPHCHCIEVTLDKPSLEGRSIRFGLGDNVKLGANALAGFPSLKTIPFDFELKKSAVHVFQQPSRNDSIILSLKNIFAGEGSLELAEKLLGNSVYIGWPFLTEAKVVAISDELMRYERSHGKVANIPHDSKGLETWKKTKNRFAESYGKKGTNIGKVEFLVHVKKLKGLKRTIDGAYEKEFEGPEAEEHDFALQIIVEEVANEDERFKERPSVPIKEEFPLDSQAVFLGPAGYGNPVTIIGHHPDKVDIKLMKLERPETRLGLGQAAFERKNFRYFPSFEVAKVLGLHPLALSKITSQYMVTVDNKKYDIGLSLKFEAKRLKVLGYSRRGLRGWEFSTKTIELIKEYRASFPNVFEAVVRHTSSGIPDMAALLGVEANEARSVLDNVRRWIKSHTVEQPQFEAVALESDGLTVESVRAIEQKIITYFDTPEPVKVVRLNNIPRGALLAPSLAYHQLRSQRFALGDRVVSALNFGKVKLFSRGTVVGINSQTTKVTLDVLFDHEFDAGNTLGGRGETKRGLTVDAGSVVNLTDPQLVYHSKKSKEQYGKDTRARAPGQKKPVPAAPANAPPSAWKQKPANANTGRNGPANGPGKGSVRIMKRPAEQQTQVSEQNGTEKDQGSKDLLALLKGQSDANANANANADSANGVKENGQNEDPFKKIGKNKAKNKSKNNVFGAVYGSYMGAPPPPPPPGGFMPPPPPPGPGGVAPYPPISQFQGFMPPPPPPPGGMPFPPAPVGYDAEASAELLAALNINQDQPGEKIPSGPASGRGRGNGRGRGRGGRGRGRGRGGRGNN